MNKRNIREIVHSTNCGIDSPRKAAEVELEDLRRQIYGLATLTQQVVAGEVDVGFNIENRLEFYKQELDRLNKIIGPHQ